MRFGLLLANVTYITYQLSQLFDDTIANKINLFHLECVVFLRQGFVGLLISITRPTF